MLRIDEEGSENNNYTYLQEQNILHIKKTDFSPMLDAAKELMEKKGLSTMEELLKKISACPTDEGEAAFSQIIQLFGEEKFLKFFSDGSRKLTEVTFKPGVYPEKLLLSCPLDKINPQKYKLTPTIITPINGVETFLPPSAITIAVPFYKNEGMGEVLETLSENASEVRDDFLENSKGSPMSLALSTFMRLKGEVGVDSLEGKACLFLTTGEILIVDAELESLFHKV